MLSQSHLQYLMAAILLIGSACLTPAEPPATPTQKTLQDRDPAWSPDGRRVAFASNRTAEGTPANSWDIWLVGADGEGLTRLTEQGDCRFPTWSPDGSRIAYQCGNQIWEVQVATGRISELTEGERGWFAPDWHPRDIGRILCHHNARRFGDNDLYFINPQTFKSRESGRQIIRERHGGDERARWSGRGTHIAFIGEVIDRLGGSSTWYLMTMRTDGTELRTYGEMPKDAARPSWVSDRMIVMVDGGSMFDLETGEMTNPFGRRLCEPDVSRDGRQVVFSGVNEDGSRSLFIVGINGGEPRRITGR